MNSDKEISSDEEAYEKFIVVCEQTGDESEKENQTVKKIKTKKEQFDKIISFTNDFNEDSMDRITYEKNWEQLTYDLNEIGPPKRSSADWRRIWSSYKYNRKRKRSFDSSSRKRKETTKLNIQPPIPTQGQPSVSTATQEAPNVMEQILKQLQVVTKNQVSMLIKMDITNQHLEIIAKKQ